MKIAEVSEQYGISADTLRYYERIGLIPPVTPPRRFIAGADAISVVEQKVQDLHEQINAYRDLSTSMALEAM